ncbi:MAG: hypothetical protein NTZ87_00150 [Candidatus Nomurabacteria bacterium]|nr:hypothetical protein [Candidatus Nomurabacteria bacterium]
MQNKKYNQGISYVSLISILAVISVVVLGGGYYFLTQNNQQQSSQNTLGSSDAQSAENNTTNSPVKNSNTSAENVPVANVPTTNSNTSVVNTNSNPVSKKLSGNTCDYFPKNEVESILGTTVSEEKTGDDSICNYSKYVSGLKVSGVNLPPQLEHAASLQIQNFGGIDVDAFLSSLNTVGKTTSVSGIGDKALWLHLPVVVNGVDLYPNSIQFYFTKNNVTNVIFEVAIQGSSGGMDKDSIQSNEAVAEKLAKMVVLKLPQ